MGLSQWLSDNSPFIWLGFVFFVLFPSVMFAPFIIDRITMIQVGQEKSYRVGEYIAINGWIMYSGYTDDSLVFTINKGNVFIDRSIKVFSLHNYQFELVKLKESIITLKRIT